jgi:hypothetical protein
MTLQRVFTAAAAYAFASALLVACKGEEVPLGPRAEDPVDEDAGSEPPDDDDSGTGVVDRCILNREEGCPCTTEGEQRTCSVYYFVEGEEEKVACMQGYVYCLEGEWTSCIGVRIVQVPPSEIPPGTLISEEPPAQLGNDGGL